MKETAGFRARQLAWRTLASALLFLAVGAYVPPDAAAASIPLSEVGPALGPPQGILVVYSERYVIEDDGVLVFRRRPVEVYTDTGQLVGGYAPMGDAPIRLEKNGANGEWAWTKSPTPDLCRSITTYRYPDSTYHFIAENFCGKAGAPHTPLRPGK